MGSKNSEGRLHFLRHATPGPLADSNKVIDTPFWDPETNLKN